MSRILWAADVRFRPARTWAGLFHYAEKLAGPKIRERSEKFLRSLQPGYAVL